MYKLDDFSEDLSISEDLEEEEDFQEPTPRSRSTTTKKPAKKQMVIQEIEDVASSDSIYKVRITKIL